MYILIDPDKTSIKLRRALNNKNITAKEIANELNVTQMCIYRWLNGYNLPSYENMIALSIILETPIENLIEYSIT